MDVKEINFTTFVNEKFQNVGECGGEMDWIDFMSGKETLQSMTL